MPGLLYPIREPVVLANKEVCQHYFVSVELAVKATILSAIVLETDNIADVFQIAINTGGTFLNWN